MADRNFQVRGIDHEGNEWIVGANEEESANSIAEKFRAEGYEGVRVARRLENSTAPTYRGFRDGRIQAISFATPEDVAYWSKAFGVCGDELKNSLRKAVDRDAAAGTVVNVPGLD